MSTFFDDYIKHLERTVNLLSVDKDILKKENELLRKERDAAIKRLAFISASVGLEVVKEEKDAAD